MIGQQVGNYRVISLLGQGGMGEVYLAEHVTIGTRVAIKVLQSSISKDQEQVNRFFNEAKAVSKIRHSGPVKIFDCGYHENSGQRVAYLAMEFLEGESLAARIKRLGTLPGEQVADIGRQIAGVLDAVHTAGITHRDLKPDNIFLVPDHELASGERVKVLDFGIAKLTGTMAGPQTKGTMGTPAYMAPEQWNNSASVDGRADCYSLGCVMFEMAVGKPPFPSQSIGEACNHHLNTPPPRASQVIRAIPPEFDSLVDRMLSKTVDQRPTIKEVARAFDSLRSSGATQRWQAAAVSGVQATVVPETLLGSQPNLGHGSQPALAGQGSQPALAGHPSQPGVSGQYGSQPGMSAQYGSQPGPVSGQYGSQPAMYPPQHHTPHHPTPPPPQHHTPQHHTPHHPTPPQQLTPHHPTPAPQHFTPHHAPPQHFAPPAKSNKGLLIGIGALVLVGGGVAAAVVATSGSSDSPGPTNPPVVEPVDKPSDTPSDKPTDKPGDGRGEKIAGDEGKPAPSKRDQIVANNAFVDRGGVRVLSSQITAAEYELVIGKLPDGVARPADPEAPVASLTQQEAIAFCTAIDAHLPTSEEWEKAAKGAWGIAVDAVAGPLQEWTSTVKDELAVVRGGHAGMQQAQLDTAARHKPAYFLQKDPTSPDRKIASSPTIGFRCVDGNGKTAAVEALPKDVGTKIIDRLERDGLGTLGKANQNGGARQTGSVAAGGANVAGSLSGEVIRRVIKRHMGAIRYCYERELLKTPNLVGRVAVKFVISPTGNVSSASATGLPVVSECIVGVVKRAKFPAPDGGGSVTVNYPFIFDTAG